MLVSSPDAEIISHEIMLVRGGASRVIIVQVGSVCVAGLGRAWGGGALCREGGGGGKAGASKKDREANRERERGRRVKILS